MTGIILFEKAKLCSLCQKNFFAFWGQISLFFKEIFQFYEEKNGVLQVI